MQFAKKSEVRSVKRLALGALVAVGLAAAYGISHVANAGVESLFQAPQELHVDGRKFVVFPENVDNEVNFDGARAHCQSLGFELAPVKSEAVIGALNTLTSGSKLWIGLKKLAGGWAFVDGSTYVDGDLPWSRSGYANEECAVAIGVTIFDAQCADLYGFVCEDLAWKWRVSLLYLDSFVVVKARGYGYNGARAFCQQMSSELAIIESVPENNAIAAKMADLHMAEAWIGVTHASGSWLQVDGNSPLDGFGSHGEAAATTQSRALILRGLGQADWSWRDYAAPDVDGFICEGYEWALVRRSAALSWSAANAFCEAEFGTFLSTVHDSATNLAMAQGLQHYGGAVKAFIGLSDLQEGEWRWVDESPKTFMDWGPWMAGEGAAAENSQDCAVLQGDGHWLDVECAAAAGVDKFFCSVVAKANRGPECWCKTPSSDIGTLVAVDRALGWQPAQDYCQDHGLGHLASIHGSAQNDDVRQCLAVCGLPSYGWIGLSQGVAAHYNWSDSSPLNFENWATDNPVASEHVYMDQGTGKWHNVAGDLESHKFICKVAA